MSSCQMYKLVLGQVIMTCFEDSQEREQLADASSHHGGNLTVKVVYGGVQADQIARGVFVRYQLWWPVNREPSQSRYREAHSIAIHGF